jgi:hypothetical protein
MYILVLDLHEETLNNFDLWKESKKNFNKSDYLMLMIACMAFGTFTLFFIFSEITWNSKNKNK